MRKSKELQSTVSLQNEEWVEQNGVLTRRQLIQGLGATSMLALTGCYGDATYEIDRSIFTFWQKEAARYEQDDVYSMDNPGDYDDKIAAHVPDLSYYAEGTAVVAVVDHPMTKEHWVEAIYFKDQNGDVFYLQHLSYQEYENKAEKREARAYCAIPEGVTQVTAYAFCNLHGTWKSEAKNRA